MPYIPQWIEQLDTTAYAFPGIIQQKEHRFYRWFPDLIIPSSREFDTNVEPSLENVEQGMGPGGVASLQHSFFINKINKIECYIPVGIRVAFY